MKELTPKQIVAELDRYIIGQATAKKAVAIAVRDRWRRQQLPAGMRDEVIPKNILMIGPTGVGKTEIARRLAALVKAPFLKVEASRYSEVGYHGKDVESMIRDLTENAVRLVRAELVEEVREPATRATEERVLDLLVPPPERRLGLDAAAPREDHEKEREAVRAKLRTGELDNQKVEVVVEDRPQAMMQAFGAQGFEEYGIDFHSMMGNMFPTKHVTRRMPVSEARRVISAQESDKLLDKEKILRDAIWRAENLGVIFIDEIDKVALRQGPASGQDVSREGVQRDLLPIVEGAVVTTRYGPVKSNHVLFIAAGAFHMSKPSDLIPELQGRFPIRVELTSLNRDDFLKILTEPQNALTRQYTALMATEGVKVIFEGDALHEMASFAALANEKMQDIGARRLHTVIEKVLEEVSYGAPDDVKGTVNIDRDYVKRRLKGALSDEDVRRFV
jgi:ATP-dependent HslUV protease ATP-binding subunit HslU